MKRVIITAEVTTLKCTRSIGIGYPISTSVALGLRYGHSETYPLGIDPCEFFRSFFHRYFHSFYCRFFFADVFRRFCFLQTFFADSFPRTVFVALIADLFRRLFLADVFRSFMADFFRSFFPNFFRRDLLLRQMRVASCNNNASWWNKFARCLHNFASCLHRNASCCIRNASWFLICELL